MITLSANCWWYERLRSGGVIHAPAAEVAEHCQPWLRLPDKARQRQLIGFHPLPVVERRSAPRPWVFALDRQCDQKRSIRGVGHRQAQPAKVSEVQLGFVNYSGRFEILCAHVSAPEHSRHRRRRVRYALADAR